MKNFNFLSMGVVALLMVVAVGCTTMRGTSGEYDEYSEDRASRRVYVDPTYYGSDQIIFQRDPFTGRYYQVSPYGYSQGRSPYYGRNYSNRNYNSSRNYNNRDNRNQQTQEQRVEGQKKINEARDIIRGKNR